MPIRAPTVFISRAIDTRLPRKIIDERALAVRKILKPIVGRIELLCLWNLKLFGDDNLIYSGVKDILVDSTLQMEECPMLKKEKVIYIKNGEKKMGKRRRKREKK